MVVMVAILEMQACMINLQTCSRARVFDLSQRFVTDNVKLCQQVHVHSLSDSCSGVQVRELVTATDLRIMRKLVKSAAASTEARNTMLSFLARAKETDLDPPTGCHNPGCQGMLADGQLQLCSRCKVRFQLKLLACLRDRVFKHKLTRYQCITAPEVLGYQGSTPASSTAV